MLKWKSVERNWMPYSGFDTTMFCVSVFLTFTSSEPQKMLSKPPLPIPIALKMIP
jgi:hypothetical protein